MSRSHKEKRSAYAPEKGVRYDGVYRIEKCWRKVGIQVNVFFAMLILCFLFLSLSNRFTDRIFITGF